jgi:hypothetical protein
MRNPWPKRIAGMFITIVGLVFLFEWINMLAQKPNEMFFRKSESLSLDAHVGILGSESWNNFIEEGLDFIGMQSEN